MAEYQTFNLRVEGSSPSRHIKPVWRKWIAEAFYPSGYLGSNPSAGVILTGVSLKDLLLNYPVRCRKPVRYK